MGSHPPPPLACNGRQYDSTGQPLPGPAGEPCGNTWKGGASTLLSGNPLNAKAESESAARASGWRISPTRPDGTRDIMCDRCARPNPTTAALCRDLNRSVNPHG